MEYYIVRDGTQFGPLERAAVAAGLRHGEFFGTDLYWHDGMSDWLPLADSTVAAAAAVSDEEAAPPGLPILAAAVVLAVVFLSAGGWLAARGVETLWTAWSAFAWPAVPAAVTASEAPGGRLHVAYGYKVGKEDESGEESHAGARAMPGERFLLPAVARAYAAAHPAGSVATAHYEPSAPDRAFLEVGVGRRTGTELVCGLALLWTGLAAALAAWLLPKYGVRRDGRFRLQRGSPLGRFLPAWGLVLAVLAGTAVWMAL